jgi:hypothetical protein
MKSAQADFIKPGGPAREPWNARNALLPLRWHAIKFLDNQNDLIIDCSFTGTKLKLTAEVGK